MVETRQDDPAQYRKKVWQVKRIVDREVRFVKASQPQPKGDGMVLVVLERTLVARNGIRRK